MAMRNSPKATIKSSHFSRSAIYMVYGSLIQQQHLTDCLFFDILVLLMPFFFIFSRARQTTVTDQAKQHIHLMLERVDVFVCCTRVNVRRMRRASYVFIYRERKEAIWYFIFRHIFIFIVSSSSSPIIIVIYMCVHCLCLCSFLQHATYYTSTFSFLFLPCLARCVKWYSIRTSVLKYWVIGKLLLYLIQFFGGISLVWKSPRRSCIYRSLPAAASTCKLTFIVHIS